jgi:hypothetical protein
MDHNETIFQKLTGLPAAGGGPTSDKLAREIRQALVERTLPYALLETTFKSGDDRYGSNAGSVLSELLAGGAGGDSDERGKLYLTALCFFASAHGRVRRHTHLAAANEEERRHGWFRHNPIAPHRSNDVAEAALPPFDGAARARDAAVLYVAWLLGAWSGTPVDGFPIPGAWLDVTAAPACALHFLYASSLPLYGSAADAISYVHENTGDASFTVYDLCRDTGTLTPLGGLCVDLSHAASYATRAGTATSHIVGLNVASTITSIEVLCRVLPPPPDGSRSFRDAIRDPATGPVFHYNPLQGHLATPPGGAAAARRFLFGN